MVEGVRKPTSAELLLYKKPFGIDKHIQMFKKQYISGLTFIGSSFNKSTGSIDLQFTYKPPVGIEFILSNIKLEE